MLAGGRGNKDGKFGWDRGLDYESTYQMILRHLIQTENPRDVFLLTQLRNGTRIGEAVEAVRQACSLGLGPGKEVYVRVEKRRDNATRLVVIPEDLPKSILARACEWLSRTEKPALALSRYCEREFKVNTHALRYAFITHLLRQGASPSVVAKITGHRTLDYLITYTETKVAQDLLRELGKNKK
mgnify:CR=1 FL=1